MAPNFHYLKNHSLYLRNLIIRCCLIRKTNSVYSINGPEYRLDKEIIINRKYPISIAIYAKDYKELLSLDCGAILFDILLFIDLFTRIMSLSFFHLNIPRVQQHQLEPDRVISCRKKKATICGPV
ncbi:hypothetical protein PHYBLDRAFT_157505, partial [Phycomyces blakesleeanus NRRL 1555(-)]